MLRKTFRVIIPILILFSFGESSKALSIFPGNPFWTDNNGIPIQAHGGGLLKLNNTFYWFGEDKSKGEVNHVCGYKSNDLVTWEYLGHSLLASNENGSEIGPTAVVERPKVIYNAQTKQFVMWFHLDSSNYGLAKLGVASSNTVEGPYTYLYSIRPFEEDSRDMTVWVDQDDPEKTAYLVYATRVNLDTVIAKLTPDYLQLQERLLKLVGIHREGYAVFKKNGLFYMVMSRATGWDPNANEYMYSTNMSGPWSDRLQIAPGSSNTFASQANYVIELGNGNYIYAGDRWIKNELSSSRYVWLPIHFGSNNNFISIHWTDQYSVDVQTGNMVNTSSRHYDARSPEAELIGNATLLPCQGCENEEAVGYIGFNGKLRFGQVHGGVDGLHTMLISYTNGDAFSRYAVVKVNGEWERNVTFPSSGGGQSTRQLVVHFPLKLGNVNEIEFSNENGYAPDLDFIEIECINEDC